MEGLGVTVVVDNPSTGLVMRVTTLTRSKGVKATEGVQLLFGHLDWIAEDEESHGFIAWRSRQGSGIGPVPQSIVWKKRSWIESSWNVDFVSVEGDLWKEIRQFPEGLVLIATL